MLVLAPFVALFLGQGDPSAIQAQLRKLRSLSDLDRVSATQKLALDIRALPAGVQQLSLAQGLANLSTEGDFGRDTLLEVTTTLAKAVADLPLPQVPGDATLGKVAMDRYKQSRASAFEELAQLQRYEQMEVRSSDPGYRQALADLDALDRERATVDFTLTDLTGKTWKRSDLKGKVVLVNFWATWCPPCRKEMPDLEWMSQQFGPKGLVILAISDETDAKVRPFITERGYSYPILLDPGRKVNDAYKIQGIPKSFIYDRRGKLVAQTIDMRTRDQFLKLLAKTGLK